MKNEFGDVELVYFSGCPNAAAARANLEAALSRAGVPRRWREWDLEDPATPRRASEYGSPTVLVDGRDVTGVGRDVAPGVLSCRNEGPPTVAQISAALTRDAPREESDR